MIKVKNEIDFNCALRIAVKYLIQGFVIAVFAYYVPLTFKQSLRKPTFNEVFLISLTAALTMYMLDYYTTLGTMPKCASKLVISQEL